MIASTIFEQELPQFKNPRFAKAFAFLQSTDLAALEPGKEIEIEGRDVYAQVKEYLPQNGDALQFETHRVYYDLQCLVQGQEFFGVAALKDLRAATEYDAQNDIIFYEGPPLEGRLLLQPGDYVIVAPGEAHKPACAAGTAQPVKKIVVKVKAE